MPGSKPGERRGGRQRGTLNKVTADVRMAAQEYTVEALMTLAAIMRNTRQAGSARVMAARELLDRAHGKAPLAVEVKGDRPLSKLVILVQPAPGRPPVEPKVLTPRPVLVAGNGHGAR